MVSSELGRIEVLRAAHRVGGRALTEAHAVVADLDLVPLARAVHDLACDIGHPLLRTLDAIHLASAVLLSDELTAFVAYDHRLTSAAEAAGLTVATPATQRRPTSALHPDAARTDREHLPGQRSPGVVPLPGHRPRDSAPVRQENGVRGSGFCDDRNRWSHSITMTQPRWQGR